MEPQFRGRKLRMRNFEDSPLIKESFDEGEVLLPERHLDLLHLYCVLKSWTNIYDEIKETLQLEVNVPDIMLLKRML